MWRWAWTLTPSVFLGDQWAGGHGDAGRGARAAQTRGTAGCGLQRYCSRGQRIAVQTGLPEPAERHRNEDIHGW